MRRLGAAVLLIAAFWSESAQAQDLRIMLTMKEADSIPAEARPLYDEAVEQNDRVNYDEVARLLARASEKAPDHAPLQFLALTRAVQRAEVSYSAASFAPPPEGLDYTQPPQRVSEPFYDIADAVMQRLQANANLSAEQKTRLDEAVKDVEAGRREMSTRDESRIKVGESIVNEIRDKRMMERGLGTPSLDPLDPLNVLLAEVSAQKEKEKASAAAAKVVTDPKYRQPMDPFADLPGEYRDSFIPLSQLLLNGLTQANQGLNQAAQGFRSGLPGESDPAFGGETGGSADPFGAPAEGQGFGDPGAADPFAAPAEGGGGEK